MHQHHHDHAPGGRFGRALAVGTALNVGFVVIEVGFGLAANSMALLADAAHNLSDVLGLLLGWGAAWLARQPRTRHRAYGWGRGSILAALINATILLIAIGGIGVEAVHRLITPRPVSELIVMLVATAGIVINGSTALMFMRGRGDDLTEIHDLHIWGLSTTETALTAHLVCAAGGARRQLHDLSADLHNRFGIGHSTLQIETNADAELCRLRPHYVV